MAEIIQYPCGMSNGFFIVEGESVIAVDGGAEYGKKAVEKNLTDTGIDPGQIVLIAATHAHVDHTCNLAILKELSGAPIAVNKGGQHDMITAEMPHVFPRNPIGDEIFEFAKSQGGMPDDYLPPIQPDIVWSDEFDLKPYGVDGKIIYTPGHSLSDSCVILKEGSVILGDLMVEDRFTHGKPTIAYFGFDLDRRKANSVLLQSLQRISAYPAHHYYSGHGGPFSRVQFEEAFREAVRQDELLYEQE